MFQIRLHGRGGQGVVTAAEMLSLAAFMEGHFAQAFPSFGSERTGAPVTAFARFSDHEIRLHEPIEEPDVVLVQDRTLIDSVDVFSGLNPEGYVLVNSASSPEEIGLGELVKRLPAGHVKTVPATDLALKFIDFIHRPEIYAEFCDAFGFPATANVPARALKKGDMYYKAEELAACELKLDLGADLEKYNAIWQEIRVGK